MTMAWASSQDTVTRHVRSTAAAAGPLGPLVWQRTDTVGTELVFTGGNVHTATGTAVVAGALPHTTRWRAELDPDAMVQDLTVTCEGGGWSRTVRLTREAKQGWTCRTEEAGDLDQALTGSGHPGAPLPGIDDSGRLHAEAIVRLHDSPVFLAGALRRLGLTAGDQPVAARTIRILTPSLLVFAGVSTYQLVSAHRLRISGEEPASGYELNDAGIVTYQPARLRLAR